MCNGYKPICAFIGAVVINIYAKHINDYALRITLYIIHTIGHKVNASYHEYQFLS